MMHFISYYNSKSYENTDGQPGGHGRRRASEPERQGAEDGMVTLGYPKKPWLFGGPTLGRVRGRGPQAKRSGKDSPEGAYQPMPPACRRLPDGRERDLRPDNSGDTPP